MLQNGVGWLLAALLLTAYVTMLRRYSLNFPFVDDFVRILGIPHYVACEETLRRKLTYLFSLSSSLGLRHCVSPRLFKGTYSEASIFGS